MNNVRFIYMRTFRCRKEIYFMYQFVLLTQKNFFKCFIIKTEILDLIITELSKFLYTEFSIRRIEKEQMY